MHGEAAVKIPSLIELSTHEAGGLSRVDSSNSEGISPIAPFFNSVL